VGLKLLSLLKNAKVIALDTAPVRTGREVGVKNASGEVFLSDLKAHDPESR
jgi:hypothetical protein